LPQQGFGSESEVLFDTFSFKKKYVDPDKPDPSGPAVPGEPEPFERGGLILHIGESAEEHDFMRVYIEDMHARAMGVGGTDVLTQESAARALTACRNAVNYVSAARADMGAYQNRLEHNLRCLDISVENVTQSESVIRDADMAQELLQYTRGNILTQTAQAMLAQANQLPEGVFQLMG